MSDLPLQGRRVLVTRQPADTALLRNALQAAGAQVVEIPTIVLTAPDDMTELDAAIGRLAEYDWVTFTSRAGARYFLDRWREVSGKSWPFKVRVAAVGAATADVFLSADVSVALVPEVPSAAGLAQEMVMRGVDGRKVLAVQGSRARRELVHSLRQAGATVDIVTSYINRLPSTDAQSVEEVRQSAIDIMTFTSPSALEGLVLMLEGDTRPLRQARVVCIGSTTAEAARNIGLHPYVAEAPTVTSLVSTCIQAVEEET